jgi:hypothetical protein
MANSVAADSAAPARVVAPDSAAPARVVAAVTAARAPGGTTKSLPVTAAERVWKTKRPYQPLRRLQCPLRRLQRPLKRPRPFLLFLRLTKLWCLEVIVLLADV